jgi:hypothetical protein
MPSPEFKPQAKKKKKKEKRKGSPGPGTVAHTCNHSCLEVAMRGIVV